MSALKIFAITGNPVLHSKSPEMYNHAFKELGIHALYTRIAAENAKEALKTAKEIEVKGLNVTAPFKEDFLELVDEIDEHAEKAGAINTVMISKEKTIGFNTDIEGVAGALKENNVRLKGKQAVVIGAGGAAKAAVCALTGEKANVTIANRKDDFKKAEELAERFNCKANVLGEKMLEEVIPNADVIVSCVSTGERIIPRELLNEKTAILEANYYTETALAKDAKEKGNKFIDGREWLLFQGIKVFKLFTGKKAPEKAMRKVVYANATPASAKNNIALIGFMGTSKTRVAREIAKITGMQVIHIDKNVEKTAGLSIKEIFRIFGEERFREMEAGELKKINRIQNSVIDCGGGIILWKENREILKENCIAVWLVASPETILKRTIGNERPLLNVHLRQQRIKELLSQRMRKYAESADLIVGNEGEKTEKVAELIVHENSKAGN